MAVRCQAPTWRMAAVRVSPMPGHCSDEGELVGYVSNGTPKTTGLISFGFPLNTPPLKNDKQKQQKKKGTLKLRRAIELTNLVLRRLEQRLQEFVQLVGGGVPMLPRSREKRTVARAGAGHHRAAFADKAPGGKGRMPRDSAILSIPTRSHRKHEKGRRQK